MLEIFSPAEKLHAALTRRIPASYVELCRDENTGLAHVEIFPPATHRWTYMPEASRRRSVTWTSINYQWRTGPDAGADLPVDEETTADVIAAALGVPAREQPAT